MSQAKAASASLRSCNFLKKFHFNRTRPLSHKDEQQEHKPLSKKKAKSDDYAKTFFKYHKT